MTLLTHTIYMHTHELTGKTNGIRDLNIKFTVVKRKEWGRDKLRAWDEQTQPTIYKPDNQ